MYQIIRVTTKTVSTHKRPAVLVELDTFLSTGNMQEPLPVLVSQSLRTMNPLPVSCGFQINILFPILCREPHFPLSLNLSSLSPLLVSLQPISYFVGVSLCLVSVRFDVPGD